jgi:asparaginyl-tRNA synthetase
VGASIRVTGVLEVTVNMKQPFELKAREIIIEGESSPAYPLQKKRHSFEYLRTIAHLRPRTNTFSAVFRVRSIMSHAIHTFFQDRGFVYVHTPIITGSDCEGAGEMFRVTTLDPENPPRDKEGKVDFSKDFFGTLTGLTVSGQLNVEAFCMAFGKVYTFGPTFRAENSNTARANLCFCTFRNTIREDHKESGDVRRKLSKRRAWKDLYVPKRKWLGLRSNW